MAPAPAGGGCTTARLPQQTALTLISSFGVALAPHGPPAINFVVAKPQRPETSIPNTPSGAWLLRVLWLPERLSGLDATRDAKAVRHQRPD